jgi:hypothetical protein
MLIVIAITGLIVTTAVQAHLTIRQVQARAALGLSRDRAAEVFLDRFERELAGTFLVVRDPELDRMSHPYVFVGEDRFEAETDADAIRFVTTTPVRAEPFSRSSGLRLVTYAVHTADDGGLDLLREENLLPEQMQKEPVIEEGRVALDHVASFRLDYLDDDSGELIEYWDSTQVELLDRLPLAVEVTLILEEDIDGTDEVGVGPQHRRIIPLPVRPFDLAELRAAALGADGEAEGDDPNSEEGEPEDDTCVTIEECALRFTDISNDPQYLSFARTMSRVRKCYDRSKDRWFTALLNRYGHQCQ